MDKMHVKGSARIFRNRYLEFFTKSHPALILSIYVPLCAYLLYYFHTNINPSLGMMSFIFLLGVFSWTFAEYVLHRYVFHFINEKEWSRKFHHYVHGLHHDFPRDLQRLIMPPMPSIVMACVFFGLFWIFMGGYTYSFFSGFVIGYLAYGLIHYATHAFRPPKNAFRILWEHHAKHHFKHPDKAFGVSSPLWDYVFGTVPPKQEHKKAVIEAHT